jgi:electron transfer flavoprotein alpha/beta subunit
VAVVDALDELDPPDEIADDYTTVIDVGRRLADLDPNDPAAVEEAQQLSEEAAAAQGRVSDFLSTECGIDLSSSGSADTSG